MFVYVGKAGRKGDREKEREQADDSDSCVHTDGELCKVKGKAGRP